MDNLTTLVLTSEIVGDRYGRMFIILRNAVESGVAAGGRGLLQAIITACAPLNNYVKASKM
jgi:hypothetical protein